MNGAVSAAGAARREPGASLNSGSDCGGNTKAGRAGDCGLATVFFLF